MKKQLFLFLLVFIMTIAIATATPTQTANIANINAEYGDNIGFDLDNFFNGYDTVTVNYADPFASSSIQLSTSLVMSTVDDQTFDNGEVAVTLFDFSNFIFLQIDTEDLPATSQSTFTTTITLTVEDGTGSITETFDLTVTEPAPPPAPTQDASFAPINIEGEDQVVLNMNNFFSDYLTTTITFTDPSTTLTETLAVNKGTSQTDSYTTSEIDFQLYATTTNTFLTIVGKNDSWNTSVNIEASNTQGAVDDDVTITTTPHTPSSSVSGSLQNSSKAWYDFNNDLTDKKGTYDGTGYGIISYTATSPSVFGTQGLALQTMGTNNYIDVGTPMLVGTSWSIATWIYINSSYGGNAIDFVIYDQNNGGTGRMLFWLEDTDADGFYNVVASGGSTAWKCDSGSFNDNIPSDEWVFLTLSQNGNTVTSYTNGGGSSTCTSGDTPESTNGHISSDSTNYEFAGKMANIQFYEYVLTSNNITTLYNSGDGIAFSQQGTTSTPNPSLNISMIDSEMMYNEVVIYPLEYHFENFVGVTIDWTDPNTGAEQLSTTKNGSLDSYSNSDYTLRLNPTSNDVQLEILAEENNVPAINVSVVVDGNNASASDNFEFLINDSLFDNLPTKQTILQSSYNINQTQQLDIFFPDIFDDYNQVSVVIEENNGTREILDNFQICCGGTFLEDTYNSSIGLHRMYQGNRIGISSTGFATVALNDAINYEFTPHNSTGSINVSLRAGNDIGYITQDFTINTVQGASGFSGTGTASPADITLTGFEATTVDFNRFFTNYDNAILSFIDPATNIQQTLITNLLQNSETQIYDTENVRIELYSREDTAYFFVYARNQDWNTTLVLTAQNTAQATSTTSNLLLTITAEDVGVFPNVLERLGSVFPQQESLTQGQKWSYVIVTLLILNILGAFLLARSGVETSVIAYICIALSVLLFFYFVIINYIPVGVMVVLALIVLSLSLLKIRSSTARGV